MNFLSYFYWRPEGDSTFQLRTQNKGNCFSLIIRLKISLYAFCNTHIVCNKREESAVNQHN